jgi:hypothetical protein
VSDDELFFLAEAISHARSLTFGECLQFMRGLQATLGDAHPAKPQVQAVLAKLTETDAQLELLAVSQLKFRELLRS